MSTQEMSNLELAMFAAMHIHYDIVIVYWPVLNKTVTSMRPVCFADYTSDPF